MQSCHKSHPWCSSPPSGGNSDPGLRLKSEGLRPLSGTPAFKICAREPSPKISSFENQARSRNPTRLQGKRREAALKGSVGSDPPGGPSQEAPRPRVNEAHLLILKHRPEGQASNLAQLRACWPVGIILMLYLCLTLASEHHLFVVVDLFPFPTGTTCTLSLCLIAAGGRRLHTPCSALQSTSISCRGALTRV